jgi:hypothetical protein
MDEKATRLVHRNAVFVLVEDGELFGHGAECSPGARLWNGGVPEPGAPLTLTMDLDTAEVEIRSLGPSDSFFARGFGATRTPDLRADLGR